MKRFFMVIALLVIWAFVVSGYAMGPTSFDNGWLRISKIQEGVYQIIENYANCYLVIGQKEAVLIDSAYGASNLQKLCHEFTKLPVTVVHTHGHWDHTGGAQYFSSVMIHQADATMLEWMASPEAKRQMNRVCDSPNFPSDFKIEAWYASPVTPSRLLSGGEVLEFGDIRLEVIATPGHTPGSICLLDRERRLLFTGDTLVPGEMWLQLPESDFSEWMRSAETIVSLKPLVQKVLPGHVHAMDSWFLDALRGALADIRAGKDVVTEIDNPIGGKCLKRQFTKYPMINILHQ